MSPEKVPKENIKRLDMSPEKVPKEIMMLGFCWYDKKIKIIYLCLIFCTRSTEEKNIQQ